MSYETKTDSNFPERTYTYRSEHTTKEERDATISIIEEELADLEIPFSTRARIFEMIPPYKKEFVELQAIYRPLEEVYEAFAQVHSKRAKSIEELNPALKEKLELNGMKYLG